MRFRPDIEGLRALAIVPVVLFHAFPQLVPGGYVGVDVFFVISGYLITSLLLQRLQAGTYSIASFYGARIRRIFPALFCMLAVVVPFAVWMLPPDGLRGFGRTLAATSVFLSNVELYRTTGYFDTATELKPLVHTWSLAVEEQYYIVFPIVLALVWRRWPRLLPWALTGIGLLSLVWSARVLQYDAPLAFYSAFSRTFELMVGSLLAVWANAAAVPRWLRETLAASGLALIVSACLVLTPETPFPGFAALWPCIGAALVIWAGSQGETVAGGWVSTRPLRWIGAMSFGLYLWHWPVLVFLRHAVLGQPSVPQILLAIACAVGLAWASLRWIEVPLRRAAHTDRRLLLLGAFCIAVSASVAGALLWKADTLQALTPRQMSLHAGAKDANLERRRCHDGTEDRIAYADRCRFGAGTATRHGAVWADSHGAELTVALGELARQHGESIVQVTSSSCPPVVGVAFKRRPNCAWHNDETLAALTADPKLDYVVLVARYEYYLANDALSFEAGFRRSVEALVQAGKRVVVVDPVPTYHYPVPAALAALDQRGDMVTDFGQSRLAYQDVQQAGLAMLSRLAAIPGVRRLSTSDAICSTAQCAVVQGDRPLYFDDNHLSVTGAQLIADAAWLLSRRD